MSTTPVAFEIQSDETAAGDLIRLFLADKPGSATRRAYAADLRDFFGGEPSLAQVSAFLALPMSILAQRLYSYKAELLARGASEATVNRRLSMVRSLLRFAYSRGLTACDGQGLVEGEKLRPSPPRKAINAAALQRLVAAPGTKTLRGRRDTAILRLLCENALGRTELHALNVGDFSLADRCLLLREREAGTAIESVPLSRPTAELIAAYLAAAGHADDPAAPLFRNLDHRPSVAGGRLTPDGLYFLVRQYGRTVAIDDLTPYRLRHSAIAAALEAPSISLRRVMSQRTAVSRHLAGGPAKKSPGR